MKRGREDERTYTIADKTIAKLVCGYLMPYQLLIVSRVSRMWLDVARSDEMWTRHRDAVIRRIPFIQSAFVDDDRPIWQVFLRTLWTIGDMKNIEDRKFFWIILANHGAPTLLTGYTMYFIDFFVLKYVSGKKVSGTKILRGEKINMDTCGVINFRDLLPAYRAIVHCFTFSPRFQNRLLYNPIFNETPEDLERVEIV